MKALIALALFASVSFAQTKNAPLSEPGVIKVYDAKHKFLGVLTQPQIAQPPLKPLAVINIAMCVYQTQAGRAAEFASINEHSTEQQALGALAEASVNRHRELALEERDKPYLDHSRSAQAVKDAEDSYAKAEAALKAEYTADRAEVLASPLATGCADAAREYIKQRVDGRQRYGFVIEVPSPSNPVIAVADDVDDISSAVAAFYDAKHSQEKK